MILKNGQQRRLDIPRKWFYLLLFSQTAAIIVVVATWVTTTHPAGYALALGLWMLSLPYLLKARTALRDEQTLKHKILRDGAPASGTVLHIERAGEQTYTDEFYDITLQTSFSATPVVIRSLLPDHIRITAGQILPLRYLAEQEQAIIMFESDGDGVARTDIAPPQSDLP
ncbi:hypothetical protein EV681_0624 [Advenella incenata]|jgi:hypothetical protein|uniref:Uncharacterized protein n=1 Tax=Advenella incenata TaxID=267800 RepID=A0A4V6MEM4_9BURK|nr:hypothetical protein [Advenella incenata]RZT98845.1 hypothetical protein EV681_0624 [Advenella incenata]